MDYNSQNHPLVPGEFFHIYNKGNDGKKLFYQERNHAYFLNKFDHYLSDYLDVYTFCLMSNHFHFLVKLKGLEEIIEAAKREGLKFEQRFTKSWRFSKSEIVEGDYDKLAEYHKVGLIVSEKFRRLFLSYSKSINKQEGMEGSLFRKLFRRKRVSTDNYFKQLVYYIHNNPVHHGFVDKMEDWHWSSYNLISNGKRSKLKKEEVVGWFEGKEAYDDFHSVRQDLGKIDDLIIED